MHTTSESAEEPAGTVRGFWNRQFSGKGNSRQIKFDLLFGVLAPILCVILDPVVFVGLEYLQEIRLFGYLEIAMGVAALVYYLLFRKASLFLAGMLYGAALFSFVLGCAMLPISILGLFVVIGIFGFTPFVSAFVVLRNAHRCRRDAWPGAHHSNPVQPRRTATLSLVLGFVLILGVPLLTQAVFTGMARRAMANVLAGPDGKLPEAVTSLKLLRIAANTDQIVTAYQKSKTESDRERFAWAYREITGQDIQHRISELAD